MKPKIGNTVIIIKNSKPDSGLWNRNGEMDPTIGQTGIIQNINDDCGPTTFRITFKDESLNGETNGWWYWESDFELIFEETLITY